MALHDFVLGGREPAGLVQNVFGNGQLPHVVQERGGLDRLNFAFVFDAQRAREMDRAVLHAPRVVVRDFILGVDRVRERFDGPDIHAIDLGQMVDLIRGAADRVPERHVQEHRQRRDQDQRLERAEARQQDHQHRGEDPAEIGEPDACQVLAPDRQDGDAPLEADGHRHQAAVQTKVERPEQQQRRQQAQRGQRTVERGMIPFDREEHLGGHPEGDGDRRHVEQYPVDRTRRLLSMRADSTRPSRAAVIAPADGPNSSAAAMLNVSEIEKLIGMAGMRSVAQPLATVRPTRINHSRPTGWRIRS